MMTKSRTRPHNHKIVSFRFVSYISAPLIYLFRFVSLSDFLRFLVSFRFVSRFWRNVTPENLVVLQMELEDGAYGFFFVWSAIVRPACSSVYTSSDRSRAP